MSNIPESWEDLDIEEITAEQPHEVGVTNVTPIVVGAYFKEAKARRKKAHLRRQHSSGVRGPDRDEGDTLMDIKMKRSHFEFL